MLVSNANKYDGERMNGQFVLPPERSIALAHIPSHPVLAFSQMLPRSLLRAAGLYQFPVL